MKRNFCLGSEWLYYKIYTGVKTADIILAEELYSIIKDLLEQKIITQWFFIRYKDPEEHLRIRFYCEDPTNAATIITALYPLFNDYLEKRFSLENPNRYLPTGSRTLWNYNYGSLRNDILL